MKDIIKVTLFGLLTFPIIVACSDDDENTDLGPLVPAEEVFGKANDVFSADEWYPGGLLGTTEKASNLHRMFHILSNMCTAVYHTPSLRPETCKTMYSDCVPMRNLPPQMPMPEEM